LKIWIKSLLPIPELPSVVEMEKGTLRDLFLRIFQQVRSPKEIINPETGEIKEDSIFEAHLNGTPFYNLPKGIDTELSDGDTLMLTVMMIGGG
jgi:hypothetical protein